MSLDTIEGHCAQQEALTQRGSCRVYGLHSAPLLFAAGLLSHSQTYILDRPLLVQRWLRAIVVNILNLCV